LPKKYKENDDKEYPLTLFLDGHQFHNAVPMPSIMDNMIDSGIIQPTVTVLLANAGMKERFIEYDCDDKFTKFIANNFITLLREGKLKEENSDKEHDFSNITDNAQHLTIWFLCSCRAIR